VPAPVGGVVDVEALAVEAAGARPLLEQRAAVGDHLDPVLAGLPSRGPVDVPATDPEVELAVLGRLARLGARRRLRMCRPRDERDAGADEDRHDDRCGSKVTRQGHGGLR
jgi:hypothetical protein